MPNQTINSQLYLGGLAETLIKDLGINPYTTEIHSFAEYLDDYSSDELETYEVLSGFGEINKGLYSMKTSNEYFFDENQQPVEKTIVDVSAFKWNAFGVKEALIITEADIANVKNIVDVNVQMLSDEGVSVKVEHAKRGTITTGEGDDTVFIYPKSNSSQWSNEFKVDLNGGNDFIEITSRDGDNGRDRGPHSVFTEWEVDMGTGNDTVDASGIVDPIRTGLKRQFEGGEGIDVIQLPGGPSAIPISGGSGNPYDTFPKTQFSGFEVVVGTNHFSYHHYRPNATFLKLDEDILEANKSGWGVGADGKVYTMLFHKVHLVWLDAFTHQDTDGDDDDWEIDPGILAKVEAETEFSASDISAIELHTDDADYVILTADITFDDFWAY
ncbi:hypothetical protein VIBNISOn1_30214 [Vibrio nigripulchritudo SOn1]|uniref:RTX toxins and related Ca2+-binding protein n=1 Tax=Vibrio nigripulchritudo SOn1 TaxID=1238450 RepID=A0AAV2VS20_9VIBR|nr:hypothetical protein [Vibrio nigripulchritudo]CCO47517.1 hypothetical protein VIBNISOn1_30214 [Vibrio nigripulchritudo SOn1]